ncbi:hypothetical protein MKW98_028613 [Papaver atlanticum]|uniref:Uncharacterized protein n=1 Tax=Papaver atlanticum TaxID=357466 RepID=A0AAD4X630_9MAGN|nr:hypothetical protein MKW98_028613 [Papaver atlanticum]
MTSSHADDIISCGQLPHYGHRKLVCSWEDKLNKTVQEGTVISSQEETQTHSARFQRKLWQLLDQIMELQDEVDQVNYKEYDEKLKLKEVYKDKLRWDDKYGCLRHPCITPAQERLFDERSEIAKSLPHFWSTALFADFGLLRYMNEEEQKIMLKYLKSVNVIYHGDAKSGYTIYLNMDTNPYFDNSSLAKTFRFCRGGISSEKGTEIRWMEDKGIEVFAEKGGTQSHTDKFSFFKWFREGSETTCNLVAEEIVFEFWPNAHRYYLMGRSRSAEKGRQMLTEENRKRTELKGEETTFEDDKLSTITARLRTAEQQAIQEWHTMKMEYELELVKGEREVHKECESLRRHIYNRRNEIVKNIPHFWLIAFSSHYALHHLLREEDQMIFKFLNSVNVEETEDDEGVMCGYTITLNFDGNPYFENDSLTKTISGKMACFFTWFADLGCVAMETYDEVANLIKQDFWPNAGRYFFNGNLNDEQKVDLVAIKKTAQITSSLRTFCI